MAGREVGQPVVPAHRLHVVYVARAPKVARRRQVHLQKYILFKITKEKFTPDSDALYHCMSAVLLEETHPHGPPFHRVHTGVG